MSAQALGQLVKESKSGIKLFKNILPNGTKILKSFKPDGMPLKTVTLERNIGGFFRTVTENHQTGETITTTRDSLMAKDAGVFETIRRIPHELWECLGQNKSEQYFERIVKDADVSGTYTMRRLSGEKAVIVEEANEITNSDKSIVPVLPDMIPLRTGETSEMPSSIGKHIEMWFDELFSKKTFSKSKFAVR